MEKKTKHTPAPWRWEVSESTQSVQLCGGGGTPFDLIVMDFVRYGMNSAAPRFNVEPEPGLNVMVRSDALSQVVKGREHHKYWFKKINHPDALLIESAPYMMKELLDTVIDLKTLHNDVIQETGDKWDGMAQVIQNWIDRKELLIKKATGDE